ncbi:DUF1326 domain-containing protein, partial [Mycobacterium kiyosense]|uniref:DUF1326 domain-containing protein n=2 Tax=Mycobacterium kiyosense TaxID=2871094 RepID=UPI00285295C4
DVVAELAGVGPCHGDILPARPCWASQLRCHLFVQQTPKMKLMFYIDATADPDQRDALERIFTGREGGWPAQFASLIQELRGIESAPIEFDAAEDLRYWRAEIPGKVDLHVAALTGPTSDPDRRVTTANAPGAEVGPGQVATWGVVERDYARGFDWSREYRGGSSKHFAFDWRPGTNQAS